MAQSRADELARELTLILEGKTPVTMPLIILVAEANDRVLLASWKSICVHTRTAATHPARWAISRVGTLLRTIDTWA